MSKVLPSISIDLLFGLKNIFVTYNSMAWKKIQNGFTHQETFCCVYCMREIGEIMTYGCHNDNCMYESTFLQVKSFLEEQQKLHDENIFK